MSRKIMTETFTVYSLPLLAVVLTLIALPACAQRGSSAGLYVAGSWHDDKPNACYWKNGVLVDIGRGEARAVAAAGGDIYIAGSYGDTACYWKNGARTDIGKGEAAAIAIAGRDVYIAGYNRGQL